MKDLKGKVAFITGGSAGIGFALAEALGKAGMKIMIASANEKNLDEALGRLRGMQITAERVKCDVANRSDMQNAALATIAKFGKVHLVINNAGVGLGGVISDLTERDWEWVIGINVMGVVHGVDVFAPLLASHGEGGHIVNTASIAGFMVSAGMEPYSASKFAVVAMSEGWRMQFAPKGIGVSVLAPGFVRTNISDSQRNRPASDRKPGDPERQAMMREFIQKGMDPAVVAARVIEGIRADELYIFTHPELMAPIRARLDAIIAAGEVAAKSPALKDYRPQDVGALPLPGGRK